MTVGAVVADAPTTDGNAVKAPDANGNACVGQAWSLVALVCWLHCAGRKMFLCAGTKG